MMFDGIILVVLCFAFARITRLLERIAENTEKGGASE